MVIAGPTKASYRKCKEYAKATWISAKPIVWASHSIRSISKQCDHGHLCDLYLKVYSELKILIFFPRGGSSCKGGWSQPSDGWSWKGSSTISQSWEGKGSLAICNSSLMLLSFDCITCPICYNNCYHQSCLNGLTYGLVSAIFLVWGEDIFGIWFELGLNCTKSFLMICILKSQGQINETWIQPFRD